jgi:transcriptional regulator with XRE-family HTH domain
VQHFGEVLQEAIHQRGWSLRQAAPRLGVSHSLLGMITAGRRRPPLDRLMAWKAALALKSPGFERLLESALLAHGCADLARLFHQLAEDSRALRRRSRATTRFPAEALREPRPRVAEHDP